MPIEQIGVERSEIKPAYIWQSGTTFFPSKVETIIVEAYLKRQKVSDCVRALKDQLGKDISTSTVRRRMDRPHVQALIAQKLEESGLWEGWSKERWLVVMTKHLQGKERLANGDLYGMRLLAQVKGFDVGDQAVAIGSINFVQSNGKA